MPQSRRNNLVRALAVALSAAALAGCSLKTAAVKTVANTLSDTGDVFSRDNDPELVKDAIPFALKLYESVERESRRLAQFVDELLDLGRIREGRLAFHFESVSLGEVVRDVATRLDPELIRSGSSLALVTEENVVGKWDKFRIDQIVQNLLSNAIKFGLGKPIEVTIGAHDGRARLIVRDAGLGIERDAIARLFKPFERAVSERHYGGLGLGLHITRTIVEAMGGSINVDSEPGKGSVFTVELPADEEPSDDGPAHLGG